jgi:hypothetical protein
MKKLTGASAGGEKKKTVITGEIAFYVLVSKMLQIKSDHLPFLMS